MSIGIFMNNEICYNQLVEFKDWITKCYLDWRGDSFGNEKSISEFARYLGVSQSILSRWMTGALLPGQKNAAKISTVYPEIYDVLDIPNPDPLAELPPEFRESFLSARREYTEELAKRGITTDSPEARKIIAEAFERHGVSFTFINGNDN